MTGWIADRREAGSTGQRTTLWEMLGRGPHSEQRMHHLFPPRGSWWRELGIGEATHRDPVDVRVPVALPKDIAACPFGQPYHRVVLP